MTCFHLNDPLALTRRMLLVWIALAPFAHAQSINYKELEDLFAEPVTTSATGKPQKASEVPVGIDIINADQIRRMGVTSLPELLGRLPGVTTWQASRGFADVGVRGQITPYNPNLLVLVNGRQVYSESSGFTDWSLNPIELEEIVQIEVIKGPATALYGFNATAGVVNIITANPKLDKVNTAGATVGTEDYQRTYGIVTGALSDDAHVRLSASEQSFDEFGKHSQTGYNTRGEFRNATAQKVAADGVLQVADKTELRLESSYAKSQGVDTLSLYTAYPADKEFFSGKASVRSDTSWGVIESNLYSNVYMKDLTIGASTSSLRNQTTVFQVNDVFKAGTDNTFRIGAEYRNNSITSAALIAPGAKASYDLVATSGMWNWALTPEIELTNAVRVDHLMLNREGPFPPISLYTNNDQFDTSLTAFGVNSGVVWKVTDLDTLRASYGRGIQSPSIFEFSNSYVASGVNITGNPSLEPAIANNYELGYDRRLNAIGGKFTSSVFYRTTQDIHVTGANAVFSGGNVFLVAGDIGDSATLGMELGLDGTIGEHWKWDANYIYQNTVDSLTPGAGAWPSRVPLHYEGTVPNNVVKGHIGYAIDAWESDLYGEAGSSFDAITAGPPGFYSLVPMDGYYKVGGRVAYTFDGDYTVALLGSGLTHARTADNYGLENDRQVFVTVSKKF